MRKRRKFEIVSSYDTETTNINDGDEHYAFPVLFIANQADDEDIKNKKTKEAYHFIRKYNVH